MGLISGSSPFKRPRGADVLTGCGYLKKVRLAKELNKKRQQLRRGPQVIRHNMAWHTAELHIMKLCGHPVASHVNYTFLTKMKTDQTA